MNEIEEFESNSSRSKTNQKIDPLLESNAKEMSRNIHDNNLDGFTDYLTKQTLTNTDCMDTVQDMDENLFDSPN